jgi:hypothetical protein
MDKVEKVEIEVYEWNRELPLGNEEFCKNYVETYILPLDSEVKVKKEVVKEGVGGVLGQWKKIKILIKGRGCVIQKEIYEKHDGKKEVHYNLIYANL